jgi:hypothetical protein
MDWWRGMRWLNNSSSTCPGVRGKPRTWSSLWRTMHMMLKWGRMHSVPCAPKGRWYELIGVLIVTVLVRNNPAQWYIYRNAYIPMHIICRPSIPSLEQKVEVVRDVCWRQRGQLWIDELGRVGDIIPFIVRTRRERERFDDLAQGRWRRDVLRETWQSSNWNVIRAWKQ